MKLTILGGGGFRVPLVYGALLRDQSSPRIDEVVLYDVDPGRLSAISTILVQAAADYDDSAGGQHQHRPDAGAHRHRLRVLRHPGRRRGRTQCR